MSSGIPEARNEGLSPFVNLGRYRMYRRQLSAERVRRAMDWYRDFWADSPDPRAEVAHLYLLPVSLTESRQPDA